MNESFKALLATEEDGRISVALSDVTLDGWPEGEVIVQIAYSGLNYKDGLAIDGNHGRIMRRLPCVPGIDLAGTVETSEVPEYKPGDAVLATGWGLSERMWGGYAERARLKAEWLTAIPDGLTPKTAMAVGTAGFTAMLAVQALEDGGVTPDAGEVLVTGAGGGVGGIAVILLATLGFQVTAGTGRPELETYLRDLGASDIVGREELDREGKPLESERFAGVIDSVGGQTLVTALAQTKQRGTVAACGLAGGFTLPGTVMPFILRGVRLQGIDSVYQPTEWRVVAWRRLAELLPQDKLAAMTEVVPLADLPSRAADVLAGRVRGRIVVAIGD